MECTSCGVEMELLSPGIYQCPQCMQIITTTREKVKEINKKEFIQGPIIDSQESITNKEKILKLLKQQNLTSNEIATKLDLSEQDARTYLLRLKNEDKIKVIDKNGRFYVYSHNTPKKKQKRDELKNNLRFLINLLETKMTIRQGTDLTPMEKNLVNEIKDRFSNENRKFEQGSEIWKNVNDYEQNIPRIVLEKLNHLEARIKRLESEKNGTMMAKNLKNANFLTCPHCGSTHIKKSEDKSKKNSYSGETPIFATIYECEMCGYRFYK